MLILDIIQRSVKRGRKEIEITLPDYSINYSITNYKNVHFLQTDPFKLETAGLFTENYFSIIHRKVILISSSYADNTLWDNSSKLQLNPSWYETMNRKDTTIFISGNKKARILILPKPHLSITIIKIALIILLIRAQVLAGAKANIKFFAWRCAWKRSL